MAVKKFFLDNEIYGASHLNRIVGYLRTSGVCGEISNSLAVSAGVGLSVDIAPGMGWVDGCGIEVIDGLNITLPSAGTYFIVMKLDKSNEIVNDISIVAIAESVAGNVKLEHKLAKVIADDDSITNVTDLRLHSKFPTGMVNTNVNHGSESYTNNDNYLAPNTTLTYIISVPDSCTNFKAYFNNILLIVELNLFGKKKAFANPSSSTSYWQLKDITTTSYVTDSSFGKYATISYSQSEGVYLKSIVFTTGKVNIEFKNSNNSNSRPLNCKVDWEAW